MAWNAWRCMCRTRRTSIDLDFNGAGVPYGDVFLRAEREYSAYNFEHADTAMLTRHFADAEARMRRAAGAQAGAAGL